MSTNAMLRKYYARQPGFTVVYCGYILARLPISFRITLLAQQRSYDVSEAAWVNVGIMMKSVHWRLT